MLASLKEKEEIEEKYQKLQDQYKELTQTHQLEQALQATLQQDTSKEVANTNTKNKRASKRKSASSTDSEEEYYRTLDTSKLESLAEHKNICLQCRPPKVRGERYT